ncbi:MAG: hypothetical protein ACLFPH_07720 [Bacteroidales bacterium]
MHTFIRHLLLGVLLSFLPVAMLAKGNEKRPAENHRSHESNLEAHSQGISYKLGSKREFQTLNQNYVSDDIQEYQSIHEINNSEEDPGKLEQRAHNLLETVKEQDNFLENLDSAAMVTFPLGITCGKGSNYAIIIEKVHWEAGESYIEAFMSFEIPSSGEKIAFHSDHIPFSRDAGITGEVTMELISSHEIEFGDGISFNLNDDGETYVTWDCDGFKNMQVSGEVEFSRDVIVPEKENGEIQETGNIKAGFSTNISDWNNLIVELSFEPFQIKGVEGVGFYVDQAVFDYSDFSNATGMQWPDNYLADYNLTGSEELWRGIYIHEANIKLPPEFRNGSSEERFTIVGENILVDDRGFSGSVAAQDVFSVNDGKMDKWAYSLEEIGITVKANQLTQANLSGMVNIPALKDNSMLEYSAIMNTGGNYIFSISPSDKVEMETFPGELLLHETSTIQVDVENNTFVPTAILNGSASIQPGDMDMELADVEFQELALTTRDPYISAGAFSLGSEAADQALQGFPLSIKNIGLEEMDNQKFGLKFSALLHLVGESGGAFGAEADLTMVSQLGEESGFHSWNYKHTHLSEAAVDVSTGSIAMSGTLVNFDQDQTYGSGFKGEVELEIINKFKVTSTALFGKVDNLRYWYADALLELPQGPAIGPLEFNQFGGGAYYHMRRLQEGESSENDLGQTSTGIVYEPEADAGLGVKARLGFRTASQEKVFNGDATFEVSFNNNGGIRNAGFRGNGYFVTPEVSTDITAIKDKYQDVALGGDDLGGLEQESQKGQICANVAIDYSVTNKTLHGNLDTYVNIGGGVLKGIGPGGLAGKAVLHFAPDKWYIHIGSPGNPVGVEILSLSEMESYFMVGDEIPPAPEPPSEVSSILGNIDLGYMDNENELATGSGIAFGSSFAMNTGDINFLMFYGKFAAGLGYDIMLKDYQDIQCEGQSGSIGINGWYANGQAYGYFEGDIGIRVKVFGKKREKKILDIGAAAVVQAKLPNPSWMKGTVGGRYNILGGLVKGNCRFEVELGEECEFQGEASALEGMETISEVTPADGKDNIDVFNSPQAVFNLPVEEVFEIVDIDGEKKSFKVKLEYFKLISNDAELPVNNDWNDDHSVLALKPEEILPGESEITAKVKISYLEKKGSMWEPVKVNGEKVVETMESKFITSERPDNIPLHNIVYMYPKYRQYNFYQDEYESGYIKLEQGQGYLFEADSEFEIKGRYTTPSGNEFLFDVDYDNSNKQIDYVFPDNIPDNQIVTFEIVKIPTTSYTADQNISDFTQNIDLEGQPDSSELTITTSQAEGEVKDLKETNIFTSWFRTSYYNTFEEKLENLSFSSGFNRETTPGITELGVSIDGDELFSKYETVWNNQITPLVKFEAVLTDNYYTSSIDTLIYEPYANQDELTIDDRDVSILGVPPVKALYIRQVPYDIQLTSQDIENNSIPTTPNEGSFVYNLMHFYFADYTDLREQAVIKYNNGESTRWMELLIEESFPTYVPGGTYPFRVKYVLPGIEEETTNYLININL